MIKHTHKGKLMILKMVIENWGHDEGQKYGMDSKVGRLYLADYDRVNDLIDTLEKREKVTKHTKLPNTLSEFRKGLNRDEMVEMNFLFKKYDGAVKII